MVNVPCGSRGRIGMFTYYTGSTLALWTQAPARNTISNHSLIQHQFALTYLVRTFSAYILILGVHISYIK